MKKTICVISCALIFAIFCSPLFALIEGRIEGVVRDKDTGEPIEGAIVSLKLFADLSLSMPALRTLETDKLGKFKFNIKPSTRSLYYLQCKKKNYVPLIPDYYFGYVKEEMYVEALKGFRVKEGQIRFVEIELQKGGAIEVALKGIYPNGTFPLKNIRASILMKAPLNNKFIKGSDDYLIMDLETNENGILEVEGLEPEKIYSVSIMLRGYVVPDIKNILVKKNSTTFIERSFDFTDQTGVEGYVKVGGIPLRFGLVYIYEIDPLSPEGKTFKYSNQTDGEGFYSQKGMKPGNYVLRVQGYVGTEGYDFITEQVIKVVQGITYEFDINI